ncbi:ABC transporter ATP-binding protein [Myceligenerans crystallogenes]|uniref:ATP-binding cassette domain-containing protein n=1 Tax=Myceligenerans crystallogenes TaxID=316335 RepID=A0ABN2N3R5_9MICO
MLPSDEPHHHDPVVVTALRKTYSSVDAVRDITFTVRRGQITGLLGPNGAGKTTTLRSMLGLSKPTAGTALIEGRPFTTHRHPVRVVGAVLDASGAAPGHSAIEHLRTYAPLAGADDARIQTLLAEVDLTKAARLRVGKFSLGMKQRLAIATALLGDPKILILDEPGNGLDPQGMAWLRRFLRSYADGGGTVLVSSHLLTELEQVVDHVVLIASGVVIHEGTLAALLDSAPAGSAGRATLESAFLNLIEQTETHR